MGFVFATASLAKVETECETTVQAGNSQEREIITAYRTAQIADWEIIQYKMRIAIIGTRGIPASYGGFETFAEQLSTRLAARGHEVVVYCRSHYVSPRQLEYRGVRLSSRK